MTEDKIISDVGGRLNFPDEKRSMLCEEVTTTKVHQCGQIQSGEIQWGEIGCGELRCDTIEIGKCGATLNEPIGRRPSLISGVVGCSCGRGKGETQWKPVCSYSSSPLPSLTLRAAFFKGRLHCSLIHSMDSIFSAS